MSSRLHERIKDAFAKNPHLTQKGLAERMGVNPAAVNRMLHGRRNIMAEEIPVIERYLGIELPLNTTPSHEHKHGRGFSDSARQEPLMPSGLIPPPVPVYHLDGPSFEEKDIVDWIPRHPIQLGSRDAFGIYVTSNDMAPRYFKGEIAYIHPGRPIEAGRDVLAIPKKGTAYLARLLRDKGGKVRLLTFSPLKEKEVSASLLDRLLTVVGRG